jgi:hypothetical protein
MGDMTTKLAIAGLLLALAAACAPLSLPAPGQGAATPASTTPGRPDPPLQAAPASPEPTEAALPGPDLAPTPAPRSPAASPSAPAYLATVPPTTAPIVGPLPPELQEKITADLEARSGAPRATFTLVRAEPMIWSDGSLGCPQPGLFYTQVLEEGYWIVWQVDGREYDYRATQRGTFILCEKGTREVADELPPTTVIELPTEAPAGP